MRALLIILIILLQFILGWFIYKDHQTCCSGRETTNLSPLDNNIAPLVFNWKSDKPIINEFWPKIRDSIVGNLESEQTLEIVAWYCLKETGNVQSDSFALSRAHKVRELFSELPDDKVLLISKLVDCSALNDTMPFEAITFSKRTVTSSIVETEDKTLIYFASNSTKKINSAEIEAYLTNVAKRVIASGENIRLTGHTDDIGSEVTNVQLGKNRAEVVKAFLVGLGVDSAKIIVESKGESQPLGDNQTEEGRAKNRRTELEIIK